MNIELITAILAFMAAIVTGLLSWAASRRTIKAEVDKLRIELRTSYGGRLQEERMKVYPAGYELVSSLIKRLDRKEMITRSELHDFEREFVEWDSKNAILLGIRAGDRTWEVRQTLSDIASPNVDTDVAIEADESDRLYGSLAAFELGLKTDLGVFAVDFLLNDQEWRSYDDVRAALDKDLARREAK